MENYPIDTTWQPVGTSINCSVGCSSRLQELSTTTVIKHDTNRMLICIEITSLQTILHINRFRAARALYFVAR